MPLPTCAEGYVQCPYDVAHVILESRIQFHLVKCKKANEKMKLCLVECPFNSTHKIPEVELNCHKLYLCPDRKKLDTHVYATADSAPIFPVKAYEVTCSEDWDDVEVPTYDPMEHCKNLPVLLNLQGATPSDRKNFRAEERQRYRNVVGTSGQTQSDKKADKTPLRLPQTTAKSLVNNNGAGISGQSDASSKGRGRGRVLKK